VVVVVGVVGAGVEIVKEVVVSIVLVGVVGVVVVAVR
jgi:hypothetical protein